MSLLICQAAGKSSRLSFASFGGSSRSNTVWIPVSVMLLVAKKIIESQFPDAGSKHEPYRAQYGLSMDACFLEKVKALRQSSLARLFIH